MVTRHLRWWALAVVFSGIVAAPPQSWGSRFGGVPEAVWINDIFYGPLAAQMTKGYAYWHYDVKGDPGMEGVLVLVGVTDVPIDLWFPVLRDVWESRWQTHKHHHKMEFKYSTPNDLTHFLDKFIPGAQAVDSYGIHVREEVTKHLVDHKHYDVATVTARRSAKPGYYTIRAFYYPGYTPFDAADVQGARRVSITEQFPELTELPGRLLAHREYDHDEAAAFGMAYSRPGTPQEAILQTREHLMRHGWTDHVRPMQRNPNHEDEDHATSIMVKGGTHIHMNAIDMPLEEGLGNSMLFLKGMNHQSP